MENEKDFIEEEFIEVVADSPLVYEEKEEEVE